jgi:uncharacterized protein YoxC
MKSESAILNVALIFFAIILVLSWIAAGEKNEKYEGDIRALKKSLDIFKADIDMMREANANLAKKNKSLRKRLIVVSDENEKLNLIIPIAKKLSAYIIGSANMCDMDTVLLLDYSRSLTKKIAGIKK